MVYYRRLLPRIQHYRLVLECDFTNAEELRNDCNAVQQQISNDRKRALDSMQDGTANLNTLLLTIHILQESQELIGQLRHMIRGMNKFADAEE